ncbi:Sulfate/thiosulfate import ATP-binding protein CysA [Coccomyxa sp. Obi]|nr:Sulfate/thiosulfate import ATP-binding protein CysA [Coccomyxa sp. Obi]
MGVVRQQQQQQLMLRHPNSYLACSSLRPTRHRGRAEYCTAQSRVAAALEEATLSSPSAVLETTSTSGLNSVRPSISLSQSSGVGVKVVGVRKEYKTKGGVYIGADGIDLDIQAGKMTALLGPSGSGKTTLLRLISGLEEPTDGRIYFDDEDATELPVQERQIGFVFQSYALFRHMTVAQNIAFGPRIRRLGIDIDQRVQELLNLIELPGLGHRHPPQLSGGQRQRVALARALASNPRLLLLDEPFGALDPMIRKSVRKGLKGIIDKVGVTSILVTHDQEEAFDLADQIVIFNRGKVIQVGDRDQIRRSPATPFVLNFIDDVNQLPSNCQFVKRMGFKADKPLVMCRPSEVEVSAQPPDQSQKFAPAIVVDRIDIGSMIKYILRFDDGVVIEMHLQGEEHERRLEFDLQQRVFVHSNPDHFWPFYPDEISSAPL